MKTNSLFFKTITRSLFVIAVGVLISGCARGPKWLRSDWREYNDSVVDIANRELLLNIVRLRYNDSPGVLKIGSLTSQRSWVVNSSLRGDLLDGGPDVLSAGISGIRSERPTVSFLPGSKDIVASTLTPLSLESLYLASYLEWPPSMYWPLLVKSINGLPNAPEGGGPMPTAPPQFGEFLQLAHSLRQLQEQGMVEVGRIEKLSPVNSRIKASSLTATESRQAAEAGFFYLDSDNPDELILAQKKQVSVLRFSPQAIGTPEHDTIVTLLNLDPTQLVFELEPAFEGKLVVANQKRDDLEVGMRSILEILFLASKGVEVPECHLACNLAPGDEFGTDWHSIISGFHVLVCDKKPKCATIAVQYRDYWFYISDQDQDSKSMFFLLKLIYDAQVQGGGAENLPVLTLPL